MPNWGKNKAVIENWLEVNAEAKSRLWQASGADADLYRNGVTMVAVHGKDLGAVVTMFASGHTSKTAKVLDMDMVLEESSAPLSVPLQAAMGVPSKPKIKSAMERWLSTGSLKGGSGSGPCGAAIHQAHALPTGCPAALLYNPVCSTGQYVKEPAPPVGGDGSDTESSNSDAPALVATAHSASSSVLASSLSLVSDPASWTAEVFNAFVAEAQVIVQAAYASALGDAQRVRLVEMVLSLPEGIRLSTQKDFDMPPDVELCKLVQSRSRIADEAYGWAMGLEEAVLKNIHVFRCAVAPSSNLVGDTCIVEPPTWTPGFTTTSATMRVDALALLNAVPGSRLFAVAVRRDAKIELDANAFWKRSIQ